MTEEKQLIEHRRELVCEVLESLIGNIEAVGETNIDNKRFINLQVLEGIIYPVVSKIGRETSNVERWEGSMKQSGKYAISILKELKVYIDDTLEGYEK